MLGGVFKQSQFTNRRNALVPVLLKRCAIFSPCPRFLGAYQPTALADIIGGESIAHKCWASHLHHQSHLHFVSS